MSKEESDLSLDWPWKVSLIPLSISGMNMWPWLPSAHGRASDAYYFSFCAMHKVCLLPFLAPVLGRMLFSGFVIPFGPSLSHFPLSHLELHVAIPFLHDLFLPLVLYNICFSSVIYFYPEDRSYKFFLNISMHSPGYTRYKPEDHNLNLDCLAASNLDTSCIQNSFPFIISN